MSFDPPAAGLKLQTVISGDVTTVKCSGRLMHDNSDALRSEVKALMQRTKRIAIDLSDVTQMDSLGIGTVVAIYVSAKAAGCDLQLINLSKRVRDLLRLTNLLSVFETYGEHIIKTP